MAFLELIGIIAVVYVVSDFYRRMFAQERRFRVTLFLLKATQKALAEAGSVSYEALYAAQKKTLYSMEKSEMEKAKRDLAKEGIDIKE